jgi:hypothetical protein
MLGLVIFAFIIIVAALSGPFGVDSREDSSDPRRSPYPVGIS